MENKNNNSKVRLTITIVLSAGLVGLLFFILQNYVGWLILDHTDLDYGQIDLLLFIISYFAAFFVAIKMNDRFDAKRFLDISRSDKIKFIVSVILGHILIAVILIGILAYMFRDFELYF